MSNSIDASGATTASANDTGFFGHPRGLSTLFFTEMWERFSYYGMRAILTLYMTKTLAEGGLAFDEKYASLIYATYVSSVWYLPLVGGWLADKVFGARRAVLIGGIVIACGHYSMAINTQTTFFAGLILIACGTGLLKPNISAMVGQLYSEVDKRRDAGFSIFYMGINLGAFLSPIVVGYLAQNEGFRTFIASLGLDPNSAWHWGFGAAGVGMTLGVIQYVVPFTISMNPRFPKAWVTTLSGSFIGGLVGFLLRPAAPVIGQLSFSNVLTRGAYLEGIDKPLLTGLAQTSFNYLLAGAVIGTVIGLLVAYLIHFLRNPSRRLTNDEPEGKWFQIVRGHSLLEVGKPPLPKDITVTDRPGVAGEGFDIITLVLGVAGAVAGATLGYYFGEATISALFPCVVGFFAGYLLGTTRHLNGDELKRVLVIFILFIFSILFWMTYEQAGSSLTLFADRMTQETVFGWKYPSSWFQSVPAIFVIILAPVLAALWQRLGARQPSSPGKFTVGLFFAGIAFVVITLASTLAGGGRVSVWWLIGVYFLQTIGELCLSPVGLSTVTKLSPARMVGLMLGVWFLSISIGSYIAGLTTRLFAGNQQGVLTRAFGAFAVLTLFAAVVLAVLTPFIKKLTPRSA